MTTFKTALKLGEKYRDINTGFEGVGINVTFYQYGCERITLQGMNKQGEIVQYAFDAAEVEVAKTSRPVLAKTPGGPRDLKGVGRR